MKIQVLLSIPIISAIFFINCGNQALLIKKDGSSTSGEITAGNDSNVYLKTLGADQAIPKNEIVDIDHPGNGLAVTGGIIGAYGLLNIAVGLPKCSENQAAFCVGVFLPALVGFPMLVYGYQIWNTSKTNLTKSNSSAFNRYWFTPTFSLSEKRKASVGFALYGKF